MIETNMVGIDPSFTRTGIAILTVDKTIVFHTISQSIGKKDFVHTYAAAHKLALELKEYLASFEPYKVVMEYAPPVSSMSPALYCLDALYHFVLHDFVVRLYHPMELTSIIGKKSRTKADSVLLGERRMNLLLESGWKMSQKRKPSHDCFEAFIYVTEYLKDSLEQ